MKSELANLSYISPNQAVLPITVYYDHSCVLCRSEIENIKARDDNDALRLVDCSPAGFDTSAMPVDQTTLMNCIHAVDAQGQWLKATDVFVVCYRAAGMGSVAQAFKLGKPVMERIYPFIVRHRYVISKLGIHKVFNALTRRHLEKKAAAAMAASQGCKDGVCELQMKEPRKSRTIIKSIVIGPFIGGVLTIALPVVFAAFFGEKHEIKNVTVGWVAVEFFLWWISFSYILGFFPALLGECFLYALKFNSKMSSVRIGFYWLLLHTFIFLALASTKPADVPLENHLSVWLLMLPVSVLTGWACIYLDRNSKQGTL